MKRAERQKTGSVVFDKRRKTWNFLWWQDGKRRSKLLGTLQQYPTKGTAWRPAQLLRPSAGVPAVQTGTTVSAIAARYESERLPSRFSMARMYRSWLRNHILPQWGEKQITDLQPREIELWLRNLALSPKSKAHIRAMLRIVVDCIPAHRLSDLSRVTWRFRRSELVAKLCESSVGPAEQEATT